MKRKSLRMQVIKCSVCWVLCAPLSFVWACKMLPDERTLLQKVQSAPEAFIGTVVKVSADQVYFKVSPSHWLKKPKDGMAGNFLVKQQGNTSCHYRYSVGQQWLYLGGHMGSSSVLLEDSNRAQVMRALESIRQPQMGIEK